MLDPKSTLLRVTTISLLILLMVSTGFMNIDGARAYNYAEDPNEWRNAGHNLTILNALELLRKDGYVAEADLLESYLAHVMNGACDADIGSSHHGEAYGVSSENLIDMTDMGGTGLDGGGLAHFFNPWDHHGVGVTEDLYATAALIGTAMAGTAAAAGLDPRLALAITTGGFPLVKKIDDWRNWQGKNAAEAAGKDFTRAVTAWEEGNLERSMYFLGYVLHLLADVTVPHHAACIFLDGHSEFENDLLKPDLKQSPQYYEVGPNDHGIYQSQLFDLSEGVYFSGDVDRLVDTESDITDLKYGHIYELDNQVYQFIDFAAHEAIEWYPFANSGSGTTDFDNWWEFYNYIETRDLRDKSTSEDIDNISNLIFHFEGVDSVTAEFEGAWDNKEAIDMSNSYYKQLGYVEAYDGYLGPWGSNNKVGGPWWCAGCLYGGPEPTATDTLDILTVVAKGGKYDDSCDGWQIAQLEVNDLYGPNDLVTDPLWYEQNVECIHPEGYTGYSKDLPVLDDPISTMEPAWRIAGIHMVDLASKLIAGMIKLFFDTVGYSPIPYPYTGIGAIWSVLPSMTRRYFDESGKMYFFGDKLFLAMEQGRWIWDGTKYIFEPIGSGLDSYGYQIDDGQWSNSIVLGDTWQLWIEIEIPQDFLPHVIRYWCRNKDGMQSPEKALIFQQDVTNPTVEIACGQPSRLVDGKWYITRDTPIILNASDYSLPGIQGSGIQGTYYSIYSYEKQKWVVGNQPVAGPPSSWGQMYEYPFSLNGSEQIIFSKRVRVGPEMQISSPVMLITRAALRRILFPASTFSPGAYQIHFACTDNVGWGISMGVAEIELVDSIEGVDVQIEPYSIMAQPGDVVQYNITINNWYATTEAFDLSLEGLDPNWFTLSQASFSIGPGQQANITLTVSPPHQCQVSRDYPFTVTATLQRSPDVFDTADAELGLTYWPETLSMPTGGLAIVVPKGIRISPGTEVTFEFQVLNNEGFDDQVLVGLDAQDIFEDYEASWFNWTKLTVFIPAGGIMTLSLKISAPPDAVPNYYKYFEVEATSLLTDATASAQVLITARLYDLDGDGKTDGKDIAVVAQAFGSYPIHPRWNPLADINQDNKIEGKDMALVAKNFGKTYT